MSSLMLACGTNSVPIGQLHPVSPPSPGIPHGRHHHLVVVRFSPLATPSPSHPPTPALASSPSPTPPSRLEVTVDDTSFSPSVMIVSAGEVTLVITNQGQRPHSFRVTDQAADPIARSAPIPPGQTITFVIPNLDAGAYVVTDTQTDQEPTDLQADLEAS